LISIPYGAIKRETRAKDVIVAFEISIPYGAIKREEVKVFRRAKFPFQFLMVRLKALAFLIF